MRCARIRPPAAVGWCVSVNVPGGALDVREPILLHYWLGIVRGTGGGAKQRFIHPPTRLLGMRALAAGWFATANELRAGSVFEGVFHELL